jgi:hypothetical protein
MALMMVVPSGVKKAVAANRKHTTGTDSNWHENRADGGSVVV